MLVITRKKEEVLKLYQSTPEGPRLLGSVMVLHASYGSARLGFEFKKDVKIVREEIDEPQETDK